MKGSLIVVAFFCIGCLVGIFNDFQFDMHNLSMYILYALMLQVGISIGSNKNLKFLIKSLLPQYAFSADSYHCRNPSFFSFCQFIVESVECIRLYGGRKRICLLFSFIYFDYSIQRGFWSGLQLATELGTIALLANIFREMMALLGAPLIRKYFGKLAPISAAGVNSMDVLLPSITLYSWKG